MFEQQHGDDICDSEVIIPPAIDYIRLQRCISTKSSISQLAGVYFYFYHSSHTGAQKKTCCISNFSRRTGIFFQGATDTRGLRKPSKTKKL